jgi:hypothetical protein
VANRLLHTTHLKRSRLWEIDSIVPSGNHTPATTQRVMELTLRERWLERLAPFVLKRNKIKNMLGIDTAASGADLTAAKGADGDILREYNHLTGTARYRTLRIHSTWSI